MYKTVMLPVILQGCATSSHSIREGRNMLTKFTVFERKVTIRIRPYGRKREEVRGESRELQSSELHNLYRFSVNLLLVVRLNRKTLMIQEVASL